MATRLGVAIIAAGLALTAAARSADWANLNQLTPGAEIRVSLVSGKTVRGFFQSATAESVVLNAATSQETFSRQEVKRVQLKRQGHRGRNTLIGLGVGAAGGLAIGTAADHGTGGDVFNNLGKIALTPLGAIIGTVVGVALPTGGWREIYRAR